MPPPPWEAVPQECEQVLAEDPPLLSKLEEELHTELHTPKYRLTDEKRDKLVALCQAVAASHADARTKARSLLRFFVIDAQLQRFREWYGDECSMQHFRSAFQQAKQAWHRNPKELRRVKGCFVANFKKEAGLKFKEMLEAFPPISGQKRERENEPSTSAPIDTVEEEKRAARAERFRADKNTHAERFSTDKKVKAEEALAPADADHHVNESGPNKQAPNANRKDKSGPSKKADTKQAARRVDVLGPNKEAKNDKVQEAPLPNNIGGDTPDIVNGAPTSNNTVPTAGASNIAAETYIPNNNVPIAEAPPPNIIGGGAPIIVNGAPTSNDVVPATVPVDGKAREIQLINVDYGILYHEYEKAKCQLGDEAPESSTAANLRKKMHLLELDMRICLLKVEKVMKEQDYGPVATEAQNEIAAKIKILGFILAYSPAGVAPST